jgi:adhesin/invasin
MTSTKAETKTLSITAPVSVTQNTVTFIHGAASLSTSTITGSGPVEPDGTSTSTITIHILDAYNNPISAVVPTFSATNTGSTNGYGVCSSTDALGASTCSLSSTDAETKTLSLTAPVSKTGGTVVFSNAAASATYSSITGTTSVIANGSATSTITIVLKDSSNIAISGTVPTFSATNTANGNTYGACSATDSTGTATCSLASTHAEVKTLRISSPLNLAGNNVTFIAGAAVASTSQISGTGPVVADGSSPGTVTIVLYDVNNNPVSGIVPTFSATDTGSTNTYAACGSTSVTGSTTCTFTSTKAEPKTLSITTPVSVTGGTMSFVAGSVSASASTITGTGPVPADGSSLSTITVTLKDAHGNSVVGTTPTFSATNTGTTNSYSACSSSNSSGISTCTFSSQKAETKVLSITAPVSTTGASVIFSQAASPTYSSITGTGSVAANGTSTSAITITLKDYTNVAVVGSVPTFSATNTGTTNIYGTCSSSNSVGVSNCTLASSNAETKTLSLLTPGALTGGTVVFTQSPSATNSTITGTSSITADGVTSSTITITLRDYSNTPIQSLTPTFTATNTGTTNAYGACSSSNSSGISTCSLTSTKAETKTLSITAPVSTTGGTVVFVAGAVSSGACSITGTGPVGADGTSTSTISISLRDAHSNPILNTVPTFTATNTGTTNAYGACSNSGMTGNSTCTLSSQKAETKTLSLATPTTLTGGTVVFSQVASATNTTVTATGPVNATGAASSTITITLKDYSNVIIGGVVPTISVSGSLNTLTACTSSSATTGISTCTLKSTKAETKIISLLTPVAITGPSVVFNQVALAANSSISGTGPVTANGTSTSTITIVLKDYGNFPLVGTVPTFTATNTGSHNVYGTCSATDSTGTSTCLLKSTQAETKTLSGATPIVFTGGTVTFQ